MDNEEIEVIDDTIFDINIDENEVASIKKSNGSNNKNVKDKKIWIIVSVVISLILLIFIFFLIYIRKYNDVVYSNTYLDKEDISNVKFRDLNSKMSKSILNDKISLYYNEDVIECTYKDLGFNINNLDTINSIKEYQKSLSFGKKISRIFYKDKKTFNYKFVGNDKVLKNYLVNIKNSKDSLGFNEKFEVDNDRNLKYIKGQGSHELDIDSSIKNIKKNFDSGNNKIKLVVKNEEVSNHDSYQTINTKVSSFSTVFNPYISRGTNLKTGLSYIDGVVIEPGEIFSFYKYAGPYNKKGYVLYDKYVGNGVCQIATTTYNTALLGGLEIVERNQHGNLVSYVKGGLDATVASYSNGRYVDFKFKNTYKYPIYISAYAWGNRAYVDFWSNSDAMEGKTYSTESVNIGYLGYTSYLHVYQNGVEVDKRKLATSWYKEE